MGTTVTIELPTTGGFMLVEALVDDISYDGGTNLTTVVLRENVLTSDPNSVRVNLDIESSANFGFIGVKLSGNTNDTDALQLYESEVSLGLNSGEVFVSDLVRAINEDVNGDQLVNLDDLTPLLTLPSFTPVKRGQ